MDQRVIDELKGRIRDVQDFPRKGIVFKDITTLIGDSSGLRAASNALAEMCRLYPVDKVVAIESRGFIFGGLLADRLGAGFVPVRKPGKLPHHTLRASYQLEYGEDAVEIHADALRPGERVLVVDDVVATGGTAQAVGELVARSGAVISAFVFLIELTFLKGREKLGRAEVLSLLRY